MTDAPYLPTTEEIAEYKERFAQAEQAENKVPVRYANGKPVAWGPISGSQDAFLDCTDFECLYHGTRGPGKTDALIMSFAQHVGRGHGKAWRGVLFRQTYPQLADVQAKTEKWFPIIFGGCCRFNKSRMMWEWDSGEVLMLRHMAKPKDYDNYHGHEYPWIGWEELTNWPDDVCFRKMVSCCRSSVMGVPRMIRATTNPYGAGHNWVKARYRLDGQWWKTQFITDGKDHLGRPEPIRVAIYGNIRENTVLLAADPDYINRITAAAENPAMARAWLFGDWNVVAGGMFSDVWNPKYNIINPFPMPLSWRFDRSFDWGSSKPFSVGWWAESDGSDIRLSDGRIISTVRGDLFRFNEWYGSTGQPNQGLKMLASEIAQGIVEREIMWGLRKHGKCIVKPGPADSSIFTVENGNSMAQDMAQQVTVGNNVYPGIVWTKADKSPGSRKPGWEAVRTMIKSAHAKGGPREKPGLFIFADRCPDFLRTIVPLPRKASDMDDVDTDSEDHIADEVRYRVRQGGNRVIQGRTRGII